MHPPGGATAVTAIIGGTTIHWRFFKPSLSPAKTRFKEITHWAKIGFY
jgi:CBS-domain-containing membrane protein